MSEAGWHDAGADEPAPDGTLRESVVAGSPLLLALSADCTHDLCPLVDGELRGAEIHCSCHGAAFDARTGAVLLPPANEPLPVYRLRSEAGRLLVALDD
jgi:nitrite reductase/ring-hydroxylating ferredoxin subunit